MNRALRSVERRGVITIDSHAGARNETREPEVRFLRVEEHSGQIDA